jgi:hypothetical protein
MEEKKINVDMNLFKIPHKTQKKRKPKDESSISVKTPKKNETMKKKSILKMIRQNQEERYKKLFEERKENTKENNDNTNFNNDFKEAQKYLQSLVDKKGDSVNKTLRNYTNQSLLYHPTIEPLKSNLTEVTNTITNNQQLLTPPIKLNQSLNNINTPIYGCLKNGNLPTYRNFMNQTRKMHPIQSNTFPLVNPINIYGGSQNNLPNNNNNNNNNNTENQNQKTIENKINESLKRVNEIKETTKALQQLKKDTRPKKMKRKKTVRRTYKIGKSKIHPKISVLVSNKTLRNNISTKSQLLKQVPIQEVKKFLIKRGFIKVGSVTPNDVLRKMYETASSICGEVYNHNPENLLFNYINDK